jgi:hypothetical protein
LGRLRLIGLHGGRTAEGFQQGTTLNVPKIPVDHGHDDTTGRVRFHLRELHGVQVRAVGPAGKFAQCCRQRSAPTPAQTDSTDRRRQKKKVPACVF